jgi:hypothetical protein
MCDARSEVKTDEEDATDPSFMFVVRTSGRCSAESAACRHLRYGVDHHQNTHFDSTFNGVNWDDVRTELRPRAKRPKATPSCAQC